MPKMLILLPLALLAACQTITPEELAARDRATCRSYGFKRNNDAFAACMQRLDLDRRAAMRTNRADLDAWERDFWYRRPYYY